MNYRCIIRGRVQGVFYRSHIQEMASAAGFNGYVRNLSNGDVEACVTLKNEKELYQFRSILEAGSAYSKVEYIETQSIDRIFGDGFVIN